MKTEYVVYVLYSQKFNQIYIGYTSDLIDRFYSHNVFATKGHTIKYRPWEIIYIEVYDTKSEALKREKSLKSSRGRNFIRTLILNQEYDSSGSYPSVDGRTFECCVRPLTDPRY